MCTVCSPNRYLYVNSRPWPRGYVITNPLEPPPIAQEIDIHVIDLVTLKEVGTMLRAHKAYTPNDECFFIFLDVCNEYVARFVTTKILHSIPSRFSFHINYVFWCIWSCVRVYPFLCVFCSEV